MIDESKIKELEKSIEKLRADIKDVKQARVSQTSVIPGAIKARHIGEGPRFIRSGNTGNIPTLGETATDSTAIYYATDYNYLYVWDEANQNWTSPIVFSADNITVVPWTSFTPSWENLTVGNASPNTGYYTQIGSTVHFRTYLKFGTTTTVTGGGNITSIYLPLPSVDYQVSSPIGLVNMKSGGTIYTGQLKWITTTKASPGYQNASATYLTPVDITSTIAPGTWTTNDTIIITGTYEAA